MRASCHMRCQRLSLVRCAYAICISLVRYKKIQDTGTSCGSQINKMRDLAGFSRVSALRTHRSHLPLHTRTGLKPLIAPLIGDQISTIRPPLIARPNLRWWLVQDQEPSARPGQGGELACLLIVGAAIHSPREATVMFMHDSTDGMAACEHPALPQDIVAAACEGGGGARCIRWVVAGVDHAAGPWKVP